MNKTPSARQNRQEKKQERWRASARKPRVPLQKRWKARWADPVSRYWICVMGSIAFALVGAFLVPTQNQFLVALPILAIGLIAIEHGKRGLKQGVIYVWTKLTRGQLCARQERPIAFGFACGISILVGVTALIVGLIILGS